ncbi:hypothetical protein D3C76_1363790 [compost metagenome]
MKSEIKYKTFDKPRHRHIHFRKVDGNAGDTHVLLIGETNDGQKESVLYRKGSIISKKIAVWRLKMLLRCY